jgi:hypothetical protein
MLTAYLFSKLVETVHQLNDYSLAAGTSVVALPYVVRDRSSDKQPQAVKFHYFDGREALTSENPSFWSNIFVQILDILKRPPFVKRGYF